MMNSGPSKSDTDNNNLQAIVTRNAFTQSATASVFAMHEEHIRTNALVAIETPLLKVGLAKEFSYFLPKADTYENMVLLTDIGKQELAKLHKTSTPIGKARLPTIVNMWEYPEVMGHIFKQEYKEAMFLFRDQYVKNVGLSDPLRNRLNSVGWGLGITSAGIAAYQIAKSDNKFEEAIHQTALFTGGLTGAIEAGTLAVAPCSVLAVWAPVCVAGASCAGGILGTELGEQLYQMAKEGKFSELLIPKANAAEPTVTEPTTTTAKFNLNTKHFNVHQKSSTPTLNVNDFLEQHTQPLFKNNPAFQKDTRQEVFSQSTLDSINNAWYSGPSTSPLKQLSKQLDNVNYLIRYQSFFLTQEGKNQLSEAQQQLHTKINQHVPNANEAGLYLEVKSKLSALEQISKPLLTSKDISADKLTPNPNVEKVFQAKTSAQLKSAWEDLKSSDAESGTPLSEADEAVRTYLKDHFAYNYGKHNLNTPDSAQARQEKAFMIDNAGKAGIELGKIAYAYKNPDLGDALTLCGAIAQGISSAMLFTTATGALAMGHVVGVLSALATVISVLKSDASNGMQEAFQEIFQQLISLRQELFELRKFVAQFKTDLFNYLNLYFGAVFSRFFYQEEITRNGFKKMAYEFTISREIGNAILAQLDDEVIYAARDFYEGTRDINALPRDEVEKLLTALWLRLDKSTSDYKSGVTFCKAQKQHSSMEAIADIMAMLESPIKRGQLAGYLACYYQLNNMTAHLNMTLHPNQIINPLEHSELTKLYLYARRAPSATEYDKSLEKLARVEKQATDYIQFIHNQRNNIRAIQKSIFDQVRLHIKETLNTLEYPENAHLLIQQHNITLEAREGHPLSYHPPYDVMHKFPWSPDFNPPTISNEFIALAKAGLGKFIVRNEGCPINQLFTPGLDPDSREALIKFRTYQSAARKGRDDVSLLDYTNSVLFEYVNGGRAKLALTYVIVNRGRVTGCQMRGSNEKNFAEEGRQEFLKQRRILSETRASLVEKKLPLSREQITHLLLHAKAVLVTTGVAEIIANAFPMLSFPEELSPWINLYRDDTHHQELYRAWPKPKEAMTVFNNYIENLNKFEAFLFAAIANNTEKAIFSSSDVHLVSTRLLDLNQFYTETLFANKSSAPKSVSAAHQQAPQSKPEMITPSASDEIIGMLKMLITQNQELKDQNQRLEERLNSLESKATIYVEAAPISDIATILAKWPYKIILSDEREYYDPKDNNHRFLARKLTGNWENINHKTTNCSLTHNVMSCVGDELEYIDYHFEKQKTTIPSTIEILSHTVINGALSAALPEAIGDLLFLYQYTSKKQADEIKYLVNLFILLSVAGPWGLLGTILSCMTMNACKSAGMSESNARITGNAVGFFFSTAQNLTTPMGVAATVTQLISGRLGLLVEKQAVEMLANRITLKRA